MELRKSPGKKQTSRRNSQRGADWCYWWLRWKKELRNPIHKKEKDKHQNSQTAKKTKNKTGKQETTTAGAGGVAVSGGAGWPRAATKASGFSSACCTSKQPGCQQQGTLGLKRSASCNAWLRGLKEVVRGFQGLHTGMSQTALPQVQCTAPASKLVITNKQTKLVTLYWQIIFLYQTGALALVLICKQAAKGPQQTLQITTTWSRQLNKQMQQSNKQKKKYP